MKILSLFLVFACSFHPAKATESIREISLERTACNGPCPVYTVTVYADGRVVFEGVAHVQKTGHFEGHITPGAIAKIQKKADEIHFWTLDDKYITKKMPDGSIQSVSDLPRKIITIKTTTRSKTVEDYYGAPDTLSDIERLIDHVAGTAQWIDDKKKT